MPQWTTFDQETSSALRSKLPEETVVEHSFSSAMDYALHRGETLVAVLPCRGFGQAGLAVFRWNRISAPPPPPPARSVKTRAGGFLGLSDEPVFEDEVIEAKRSWWKKFWGD